MTSQKAKALIPHISDEALLKLLQQIQYVVPGILGIDRKGHETFAEYLGCTSLFYATCVCNPLNETFNNMDTTLGKPVQGLKELTRIQIVALERTLGRLTYREIFSQIPSDLLGMVSAFGLHVGIHEERRQIKGTSGDETYQYVTVILYTHQLPSVKDLMKPIDGAKAERLKHTILPMIEYTDEGLHNIDPGDIYKPFLYIHKTMRKNGTNLLQINEVTPIAGIPWKKGEDIACYQAFNESADKVYPAYAHTISQIADTAINKKTIGFTHCGTSWFNTQEGVIHRIEYSMIETE